jgi:hypothetical protein
MPGRNCHCHRGEAALSAMPSHLPGHHNVSGNNQPLPRDPLIRAAKARDRMSG